MNRILILLILFYAAQDLFAQDSVQITRQISTGYIDAVAVIAKSLEEKLDKKSEKALNQLQKQEEKPCWVSCGRSRWRYNRRDFWHISGRANI